MKVPFGANARRSQFAQTLVFFLLCWGTIMLLCGLAIDSGLLYLAKARLGRAVDGAALAAVGNFNRSSDPVTNRDDVALIMRNFAVANYTGLSSISPTVDVSGGTAITTTGSNGQSQTSYQYNFNDGTQDANGQYRRFVQVTLNTGSGGNITSATCNARCPVQTYFIGYGYYFLGNGQSANYAKIGGYSGPTNLVDLKVSSSAVATRNPRLIMVVIDRSASMLAAGGGASGLPPAVVQFLDFFDTSSDNIGIVSFGSSARLEMPLTTNFLIAGTNDLIDAYNTNSSGQAEPGLDPEGIPGNGSYDPNYNTTGVRRLKFGGQTAADDGIRLALEQLMANSGFYDPDVVKYMVIFTDGKWNASRTLFAAPGYTNVVTCPTFTGTGTKTNIFETNLAYSEGLTNNGQEGITLSGVYYDAPWFSGFTNNTDPTFSYNTNLLLVPTLSPLPGVTNAICAPATNDFANLVGDHLNDVWQSADSSGYEPFGVPLPAVGAPVNVTTTTYLGNNLPTLPLTNYYTHTLDVWLQPGSVDYLYHSGALSNNGVFVSDYTKPYKHIMVNVNSGDSNVLVVPGYITDGLAFDALDLDYPDNPAYGLSTYPRYRVDNFQQQYQFPDDTGSQDPIYYNWMTSSLGRDLLFRNYANLLTGFYVFRPDEPNATYTPTNPVGSQGIEPLITDQPPGAPRPRYGLGAYYPSAGFYWPFGGETTNSSGYINSAVGIDQDPTYALEDPNSGLPWSARHIAYSINMLSPAAAPEWYGELFYNSVNGGGTNVVSGLGSSSASQIMTSSMWQNGTGNYPWMSAFSTVMTNEPTHNTKITGGPSVWRPLAFNGSAWPISGLSSVTPGGSVTGGYVTDGDGHYFKNTMAWSGRPTHYYDFSLSKWMPIANNHVTNQQFLQLGNWKAQEYCWHARASGVTIYTVGYGSLVTEAQQAFLAQLANATNTTAGGGTAITYNPNQPIGEQFYATNATQISNDFYSVGQAINEALTGGQ
jgi:Flp pilus assembly protein TadG